MSPKKAQQKASILGEEASNGRPVVGLMPRGIATELQKRKGSPNLSEHACASERRVSMKSNQAIAW